MGDTTCLVLLLILLAGGIGGIWLVRQRLGELGDTIDALAQPTQSTVAHLIPRDSVLFGEVERSVYRLANIYHRRLSEAEEERALLAATLRSMHEGVLVLDAQGDVRLCNEEAQRCFGDGANLVGKSLVAVSRQPDLIELLRKSTVTRSSAEGEVTLSDGRVLQVRVTPVRQNALAEPLQVVVARDVTETKRLENTRRDFIANVSHELRTPLTSIRGYAETLLAGALSNAERAKSFLEVIERHAERLTRLVDDLLALSNLELGKATLRWASVDVADLIGRVLEAFTPLARAKNIHLKTELASELPPLRCDPDRVEQILVNLVDNAIKYTNEGGSVVVGATVAAEAHGTHLQAPRQKGPWLEIVVQDTGMGIPSRDLPRLTERFYRVDRARSRQLGGTGLGLAIVKHILQAHGGAMRIESELGRGTRVYIYLPLGETGDPRSGHS